MAGFGGSVKLTGESEYKKALSSITANLKVLSSEMKVVTSQYDGNDKSVKNLSSQNEVLNKKISEQQQKVNILAKALSDAKEETGENSTTTKKWQIELNNAQSELNSLKKKVNDNETAMEQSEDATDDNAKSLKKFGEQAENSGQSALKLGDIIKANLISDAIKGGLSALANSMKQIGSALVGIGKDAIASFADYEQLIGGVETLFGSNYATVEEYAKGVGLSMEEATATFEQYQNRSNTVMENANNAYKTAGMSANEYMETVTSFSASLNASLGENAWQSANYANQAITDMSDNANKMGTDISSIQNAYQGFAKGNFTMLDNLKLGYGGTKEEMDRLMRDAEKLEGYMEGSLDKDNFADVIEAINIVQTNLGITGTTAKEANSTIAGSMASMKSSWSNFLTGLADANAPVGELLDNLMESVQVFASNIIPVIGTVIDTIVGVIGENFGSIVEMGLGLITQLIDSITTNSAYLVDAVGHVVRSIVDAFATLIPQVLPMGASLLSEFINGVVETIPTLIPVVIDVLMTFVNTILDNLPQVLQMGITVLVELIKGISETLPELIPTVVEAVITIVETLIDNIDMIIDAGIELIMALADGLINALPILIDKIPVIVDKLILAITNNLPKLLEAGVKLTIELAKGIIKAIPNLLKAIPQLIKSIVSGFENYYSNIFDIGGNLVSGIWEGISGSFTWIKNKIKGWVGNVTDFLKNLFGINSPSKLFEDEIGTNLALGIGEGFGDTMRNVNKDMANSIQTDYDLGVNSNLKGATQNGSSSYYFDMVNAFKQALRDVKVVMDDREMGTFVTDTMERVVYA